MPDLTKLLRPRSIALIGASADRATIRGRFTEILLLHGFDGPLQLISRSEPRIAGRDTLPSVAALPAPVDLAILLVPAAAVAEVLEACGQRGVRAAIVVASGFAEEGSPEGRERQAAVAAIAARYDMAVSGPNAEGFLDVESGLAATFSPVAEALDHPLPRSLEGFARIAVLAQSGALGFGLADAGWSKGLPIARCITTGNEAALDILHYLEHLLEEDRIEVFLLFLEGLQRPQRFVTLAARALAEGKPLIVAKVGRSEVARQAALSHTGALAGSDVGFRAVADRFGVVLAEDLEEAVDLAAGFAACRHRLPQGRRIGIATATGGGGGWLADSCIAQGLTVPPLDAATRARLEPLLPSYGSTRNPVDTTATAVRSQGYARFAAILEASPSVDQVIVTASGRTTRTIEREREALAALGREAGKPVLFWSYSRPLRAFSETLAACRLPLSTSLRNVARMAVCLADYGEARRSAAAADPERVPACSAATRAAVTASLAAAGPVLSEQRARALLADYGIGHPPPAPATSLEEALAAFRQLDGPAALKLLSPDIPHRSDIGALALGIESEAALDQAYDRILAAVEAHKPAARIEGLLVEAMAPAGQEMILGMIRDPQFGPLVMVGIGGVYTELLDDRVFAPLPLDADQARALLRRLRGWPLLAGTRGGPAADAEALVALLVRFAAFLTEQGEQLEEVDLNPVRVHGAGQGLTLLDALIVTRDDPV